MKHMPLNFTDQGEESEETRNAWEPKFPSGAKVKVVITGAMGRNFGEPGMGVGETMQGRLLPHWRKPSVPSVPWVPGKGIIIISMWEAKRFTLAHELGDLVGWYDLESKNTHSSDVSNLMAQNRSQNNVDCQWCNRVAK